MPEPVFHIGSRVVADYNRKGIVVGMHYERRFTFKKWICCVAFGDGVSQFSRWYDEDKLTPRS